MANGHSSRDFLLPSGAVTLGASETDTVVSSVFAMSAEDSKHCLIRLDTSSVTVTNAVTANLQHSWDGGTTWEDVGSDSQVSITGNASYQISHEHTATNSTATWPIARVVVSTGVSDACTVDAVYVSRRY